MRLLLNILWFILAGLWMAIGYGFAPLVMFIFIITIPFGIASVRIAVLRPLALRPYDREAGRSRRCIDDRERHLVRLRRLVARAWAPHRRDPALPHCDRDSPWPCELQADPDFSDPAWPRDRLRRAGASHGCSAAGCRDS